MVLGEVLTDLSADPEYKNDPRNPLVKNAKASEGH
jgi:hypothetical protein